MAPQDVLLLVGLQRRGDIPVLVIEAGQSAEDNPETFTDNGFQISFANDALLHDRLTTSKQTVAIRKYMLDPVAAWVGVPLTGWSMYTRR